MRLALAILLGCFSAAAQIPPAVMRDLQAVSARPASGSPNVTDGLVSWWKFDEGSGTNTTDSVSAATAFWTNGPNFGGPYWDAGMLGQGLRFYGTNSLTMTNVYALGTNQSLVMWVKRALQIPAGGKNGFANLAPATAAETHYPYTDGKAYVSALRSGQARYDGIALPTLGRTNWVHLAITTQAGAGGYLIYENAQPIYTNSGTSTAANQVLILGAHYALSDFFQGWFDDVRIYNRALSASEIQTLYNWRP